MSERRKYLERRLSVYDECDNLCVLFSDNKTANVQLMLCSNGRVHFLGKNEPSSSAEREREGGGRGEEHDLFPVQLIHRTNFFLHNFPFGLDRCICIYVYIHIFNDRT